jgi:hypothetical protein
MCANYYNNNNVNEYELHLGYNQINLYVQLNLVS